MKAVEKKLVTVVTLVYLIRTSFITKFVDWKYTDVKPVTL